MRLVQGFSAVAALGIALLGSPLLAQLPSTSPPTIQLQDNGTDWGARINAADAQLGTNASVIEVDGGGQIATQIVISSNHTLRFGPGTWTNSNTGNETILLNDNTVLEGHGWDTVIQEPPGNNPLSYFIVRPHATHLDGAAQANNISVRNIQFSGVGIAKAPNGSQATVNTGLLNGGTYENLWFNTTHGIGLTVGETNVHGNAFAANVTVQGCTFTNVGGGIPPHFPGGGGVTLAIVNGDNILVQNNTFIDALGNAVKYGSDSR